MQRWMAALVTMILTAGAMAQDPVADARKLMSEAKYKEALKLIGSTLPLSSRDSDKAVQYELQMLKGECQMQLGQFASASWAFDTAANLPGDAKLVAPARANALLIRASQQGKYRPKKMGSQPIDILADRPAAMLAMREDLAHQLKPRLDAALDGTTLTGMMELVPKVLDLGYLEYAAEGSAPQTRQSLTRLSEHARKLITSELRRIGSRTNVLENAANSEWDGNARGLHSKERDEVKNNVTYLRQIEKFARDARRRAMELGFDGAAWEPLAADAVDLAERSQAILDFVH